MVVTTHWSQHVLEKKDWILERLILLFVLMRVPRLYVSFNEWEEREESEMGVLLF